MLSFINFSSFSQDSWELVADIGFCVVIFGVALEIIDLIAKWRKEHRNESILVKDAWWLWWIEAASVIFVVVGLAVEFIGGFKASQLARQKILNLTNEAKASFDKAKSAEDSASKSTVFAALIGTTNTWLVASNLNLSIELEKLKQPRIINDKQMRDFIFLTEKIPKIPISVGVGSLSDEPFNYAHQFRIMFKLAGFLTPDAETNSPQEIQSEPNRVVFDKNSGSTNEWDDIIFIFHATNQIGDFQFHFESTNGFQRPIISNSEADFTNKTCDAILFIFDEMGIKNAYWNASQLVPAWPNSAMCEIYIRQKPH